MLTWIVLAAMTAGLSALTHTATVSVPSAALKTVALKCRSNGLSASGGEAGSL